jgi:hypothetical protein
VELDDDVIQVVQALDKDGKNWCKYGLLIEGPLCILDIVTSY